MLVVVVVVFPNWRFFCFRTTFLCHRHSNPASQPVKASTGSELYPGYFRLPYFLPGFFRHSFTTSATVLSGHFLPTGFFLPYAPSPKFLEQFVTQIQAGTPHPGSSSVPALT